MGAIRLPAAQTESSPMADPPGQAVNPQGGQGDKRPIPDPTVLTTAQLYREIGSLRELIEGEIDSAKDVSQAQLASLNQQFTAVHQSFVGMDERITRQFDAVERQRKEQGEHIETSQAFLTAKLDGTAGVISQQFDSVDKQFQLVEVQRVEQKVDTKAAVDAALIAQKEAVREQTTASERAIAKSETATTKQLDQLGTTFNTAIAGVNVSLTDVKERVGKIESIKIGGQQQTDNSRGQTQTLAAIVGIFLAIISIVSVLAAAGVFKTK